MIDQNQSVELFNAISKASNSIYVDSFYQPAACIKRRGSSVLAFLVSGLFMYKSASQYQRFSQVSEDLTSTLNDYVKNMSVMKLYNLDSKHFSVLNRKLDRYHKLVLSLTRKQCQVGHFTLHYLALLLFSYFLLLLRYTVHKQ